MAALLRRKDRYYAQFYDSSRSPTRKRISLRTGSKREARRILTKLEDDYASGRFDPWNDDPRHYDKPEWEDVSIDDARTRFLKRKRLEGCAESTIRTYDEVVRLLIQEIGKGTQLRKVSVSILRSFVRDTSIARATQHKRYGHLRTFFRWCMDEKLLRKSPHEQIVPPKRPKKLPKAITQEELERICSAIRDDYRAKREKGWVQEGEMIWRIPMFRFALYTGMRASELSRLRWKNLDFTKKLIYIRKQKNKKEQTIPLNSKARDILKSVRSGGPEDFVFRSPLYEKKERSDRNFGNRASAAFRDARRGCGLRKEISFHSLRHGFCTMLAEAGKSAVVIREAARHADISTSLRYVHMSRKHLKSEIEDAIS